MQLYHVVTSMLLLLADWTLRHLEDKTSTVSLLMQLS